MDSTIKNIKFFYEFLEDGKVSYFTKPRLIVEKKDSNKNCKKIKIPEEVVKKVLKNLELFKENRGFLRKNITLYELAKLVGTNSKYLRIILREHIEKTIPRFINDLRVEYALNKLKEDKLFRKYTVSSIAAEVGFSNSLSFSKAFEGYTELKPSHFIKRLNKSNQQ